MDRRAFIAWLAVGLLALPLATKAQQAGRIYRLGVLAPGTRSTSTTGLVQRLAADMRELGYVEGQNLLLESRFGEDKPDSFPGLARELVQLKPDAIVVIGTLGLEASKNATTTVPLVFLSNVDPVAAGLVTSLSRPGGNVTGVLIAPEGTLAAKKLELLKELVPRATRIGMIVPDDPGVGMMLQIKEAKKAAVALGIELVVVEVRGGDYKKAFAALNAEQPAALLVGAHSRFLRDRNPIIELTATHRLPAIYEWPQQVKDGGLMSYGANDTEMYRQVAVYVDRIFKGAVPGELPIEQPSKLELVINLKTAKALGLTIPQSLLVRADEVIQ